MMTIKAIRIMQLFLFFAAFWFIFWAHVYEAIWWNKSLLESFQSSPLNVLLYSISILALICLEILVKSHLRIPSVRSSGKSAEDLENEIGQLKQELIKTNQMPSSKIGVGFLISGVLALAASVADSSVVLAFIGLGLTFWGGMFFFVRPVRFVRSFLLDSTAASSYTTIDRITEDLNYRGKPIYIPPYPKEAYLPEHLKGLKEMIVYVPAEDTFTIPTIEEMSKRQFLLRNPKGICIAPPGYGLVNLFERELKADFTQINMDRLCESLSTIIVDSLQLAKGLEINLENDLIHVKIVDSVYEDLYSSEQGFKSVRSLGCPLASAIACALAKTTGKATIIKDTVFSDLGTVEVWYQTLED